MLCSPRRYVIFLAAPAAAAARRPPALPPSLRTHNTLYRGGGGGPGGWVARNLEPRWARFRASIGGLGVEGEPRPETFLGANSRWRVFVVILNIAH